jgi:phage gpG-like protein
MRPTLLAIASKLNFLVDLEFTKGEDPWGNKWEPLSQTTIKSRLRKRKKYSDKPLRDTGVLASSFTAEIKNTSLFFGSSYPAALYASTHQYGAKKGAYGKTARGGNIPWGDIPARPMLPLERGRQVEFPQKWKDLLSETIKRFAK